MNKRDEYVTNLKQTVDEFNEKIAELEVKAGQARAEVKAEIEKQIASLKEQAKPLTDKLDQLFWSSPTGHFSKGVFKFNWRLIQIS